MLKPNITILTATTGRIELVRCVESVQAQLYANFTHLIIADGIAAYHKADDVLWNSRLKTNLWHLPIATKDFGGTPYCVGSLIADTDYVTFLDDDNWLEEEHLENMVRLMAYYKPDYGVASRLLWHSSSKTILSDTEAAGGHIDTNCYFLPNRIAKQVAMAWTLGGYQHDRNVARTLNSLGYRAMRSPLLTVNYTVPDHWCVEPTHG